MVDGSSALGVVGHSPDEDCSAPGRVSPGAKNHLISRPASTRCSAPENTPNVVSTPVGTSEPARKGPPKTTAANIRLVGRRVDALVVAFKVELSSALKDELEERQAIADEASVAELRIGDVAFAMKRSRRRDAVAFENEAVRGMYDRLAAGGWCLEVVTRATFLATHPLAAAIALAERVANGFGTVEDIRLRRFDLAADFANFELNKNDADRVFTTRARTDSFIKTDAKDVDEAEGELIRSELREHRNSDREVTGFTIAPGNPLLVRIYDKTAELALPGREQKREIEHTIWSSAGWDPTSKVTRVEAQCRGKFLDEIRLRNPHDLEGKLDGAWQTVMRWVRIVDPSSATRPSRCMLDRRWLAVTSVIFYHVSGPIMRQRVRGGAKAEHALGAVLSRLAATGRIQRIPLVTPDGEVAQNEAEFADALDQEAGLDFIRRYASELYREAANDAVLTLVNKRGVRDTVLRLVARHNAAVARFSGPDDLEGAR